ncbi:hypothetical protein GGR56DRAFT_675049 [Xylariaceae sp. FL0804]|nr:hypothetical protein GGR56DRAFT_675049 [Xylariaceae sp. FL0804]
MASSTTTTQLRIRIPAPHAPMVRDRPSSELQRKFAALSHRLTSTQETSADIDDDDCSNYGDDDDDEYTYQPGPSSPVSHLAAPSSYAEFASLNPYLSAEPSRFNAESSRLNASAAPAPLLRLRTTTTTAKAASSSNAYAESAGVVAAPAPLRLAAKKVPAPAPAPAARPAAVRGNETLTVGGGQGQVVGTLERQLEIAVDEIRAEESAALRCLQALA